MCIQNTFLKVIPWVKRESSIPFNQWYRSKKGLILLTDKRQRKQAHNQSIHKILATVKGHVKGLTTTFSQTKPSISNLFNKTPNMNFNN